MSDAFDELRRLRVRDVVSRPDIRQEHPLGWLMRSAMGVGLVLMLRVMLWRGWEAFRGWVL